MTQLDRVALERVIAVINGKGGVLKTFLTANLSGFFAANGYRVLVVDLDQQGSLARDYGVRDDDDYDHGKALAAALMVQAPLTNARKSVRENIDLIPGGRHLSGVSGYLMTKTPEQAILSLAQALEPFAGEYDVVLLDGPPGDQAIQNSALGAARWAIIPTKSDATSLDGLEQVNDRFEQVLPYNASIDLLGVVLTDVDSSAKAIKRKAIRQIHDMFGSDEPLFKSVIRHASAVVQTARDVGKLVLELERDANDGPQWWEIRRGEASSDTYIPSSVTGLAGDIHSLASEIVERLAAGESEEDGS